MQFKMPPRRRGGGRVKAKSKTSREREARVKESSSAEDTDGNSAKEIVQRLARKYLLKSSTDTTDSEQKENIRGHRQASDPYDGDLETDGGVTTTSDMECQTDESSLMDDLDVLSPSRKTNKQANVTKTASQRRKRGQQTSAPRRTRQQKKVSTYEKQKNTSKRKSDVDQASRGSQTDSECEPQSLKKTKLTPVQQCDSGFHISPLTFGRPVPRLPKMNASDTSTPSSVVGPQRSLDDSCFGFDHIMSPQGLPFSPVESVSPEDGGHRPGSSMSSCMSSFAGSSIMSPPKRKYENVSLSGLIPSETDQKEMPAAKKPKKKKMPVKAVKNNEEWASKMSAEFDDIDMYELTIEG
ncbi:uncharacterized protein [Amphiura filiformis]|uniref:uncharacterized protein n=1 Tax=Amphiura filiformis TaxID=82378 RepID=UPI003B2143DF